jgi:hypothetical protein
MLDLQTEPWKELMSREERCYVSYLVRFWQTGKAGELVWRASVESPRTGRRRGFASPADLFAFLEQEIRGAPLGQKAPCAKEQKRGDGR